MHGEPGYRIRAAAAEAGRARTDRVARDAGGDLGARTGEVVCAPVLTR